MDAGARWTEMSQQAGQMAVGLMIQRGADIHQLISHRRLFGIASTRMSESAMYRGGSVAFDMLISYGFNVNYDDGICLAVVLDKIIQHPTLNLLNFAPMEPLFKRSRICLGDQLAAFIQSFLQCFKEKKSF